MNWSTWINDYEGLTSQMDKRSRQWASRRGRRLQVPMMATAVFALAGVTAVQLGPCSHYVPAFL